MPHFRSTNVVTSKREGRAYVMDAPCGESRFTGLYRGRADFAGDTCHTQSLLRLCQDVERETRVLSRGEFRWVHHASRQPAEEDETATHEQPRDAKHCTRHGHSDT